MIPSKGILKAVVAGYRNDEQNMLLDDLSDAFPAHALVNDINTPLRIVHVVAQLAHESDGFRTTEEYASGVAYEGREDLGNTEPGDGMRYKGRGLIMLTGRYNYRRYGEMLDLDLEENPEMAAEPEVSFRTAFAYWNDKNLSLLADKDDLLGITKAINGGTNGLSDRATYLQRAKKNIPVLSTVQEGMPASALIRYLQQRLELVPDGVFGPNTLAAVTTLQEESGLEPDGIVGSQTWPKIDRYEMPEVSKFAMGRA